MSFQSTVYRQYTTGFPGEVAKDGPLRAKPARIASATIGEDPGKSTNRISRAFGWSAELDPTGNTIAATGAEVVVGGPRFYGVLFHSKHYALYGTVEGGPLASSMDLPQGANAEFADMVIMHAEVFNHTTGAKSIAYGDALAYVPSSITTENNPLALPYGALISYSGALPAGMIAIPNSRVINPVSLSASAVDALVSTYTTVQLTQ